MDKIIKFSHETNEDSGVSPWDNTPSRSTTCARRNLKPPSEDLPKTKVSPYRPRTIQNKQINRRYSLITQSIFFESPPRSKEFPKRVLKSPGKLRRDPEKIRDHNSEGFSVAELENIERVQQLIPYKPAMLVGGNYRVARPSFVKRAGEGKNGFGVVRETNFTATFYRKFNKHSV